MDGSKFSVEKVSYSFRSVKPILTKEISSKLPQKWFVLNHDRFFPYVFQLGSPFDGKRAV